jgi:ribosomal protein L13E
MTERASLAIDTDALDKIGLEVDMRLTDVWSMLFERGEDIDTEFLGWLLRLAYVTGYWDALSEGERGTLCRQLGYPVPERRREPRPVGDTVGVAAHDD